MMTIKSQILSVAIFSYNRVGFLKQMVESALVQIYSERLFDLVELVISDNCSNDSTEDYINSIIKENPKIHIIYNRNTVNEGIVNNITKALNFSTGKYWMLFGDDDEVAENGLINIINILQKYPDKPAFLFNNLQGEHIKQGVVTSVSLGEAAQKYFYLFGNAGIFAINTKLAKESLNNYHDLIISTCWPQTEIGYRVMISSGNTEPLVAAGIISSNSPNHAENSSYNSWYIFETVYYALIRVGLNIASTFKNDFASVSLIGIPLSNGYKLHKYLFLYSTFADNQSELNKARCLVLKAFKNLKGYQKLRTFFCLIILLIPSYIKKVFLLFSLILMRPFSFKKRFEYFSDAYKKNVISKNYSNQKSMYG